MMRILANRAGRGFVGLVSAYGRSWAGYMGSSLCEASGHGGVTIAPDGLGSLTKVDSQAGTQISCFVLSLISGIGAGGRQHRQVQLKEGERENVE